jgi:MFS family permease
MSMPAESRNMNTAWFAVALLWMVALLNYFDRQLITTTAAPIMDSLHIDKAQFGLLSSVFLWVYGTCSLGAGYAADRWGRKRIIILSLIVWSAATLMTGLVSSFHEMLAARALMGVSEAFYIPAAVALIVEFHRDGTRSLATGLHLSGAYAGAMLGGLGGWVATLHGWRFGFQVFGIVGVVYALIITALLKEPDTEGGQANGLPGFAGTVRSLLGSNGFLLLLLMSGIAGAAFWTIKNWLPAFFNLELHVDLTRAGIYGTMAFNAAAFAGMLLASRISDRWSLSNHRARMWVPAIGFCIAAPCFFNIGIFHAVPLVIAAIAAIGMSQGCLDSNLMPALCTLASSNRRSTGYSLLNFTGTFVGGLMTYAGGWLKDAHIPFSTTFQGAAVLVLIAGLLLFFIKPAVPLFVN